MNIPNVSEFDKYNEKGKKIFVAFFANLEGSCKCRYLAGGRELGSKMRNEQKHLFDNLMFKNWAGTFHLSAGTGGRINWAGN